MPRLIDADVLMPNAEYKGKYDTVNAYDIVNCPTVDIDAITESHERIGYDKGFRDGYAQATSEVRHGHWIDCKGSDGKDYRKCSECLHTQNITGLLNYCPICGAKMDEVEDGKECKDI